MDHPHAAAMNQRQAAACCAPVPGGRREPTWVDLVDRFPAGRDCLAAFVVSCAAEVLAGVKPANLIRILRRPLPCGRSMFDMWQCHGAELLKDSPLEVKTLRHDDDGVLLLFYRRSLLEKRLAGRTMRTFLKRYGYPEPLTLTSALAHLEVVCRGSESPDEIGMFLGYPAKDVKGFIARRSIPWSGRCLWRIYGPPRRSLRLYGRFCDERQAFNRQLLAGSEPARLLRAS